MRVVTVVGCRPQFIKAAAVSEELRKQPGVTEVMIHTGQHHDPALSDVFFRDLDMPAPTHNLGVNGGGHGNMTGRILLALEPVLSAERPDWVIVYGDTNSTLAAALCAAKLNIPIAHVEAGLRSGDRRMPEEVNRIIADRLSTLLLCPTSAAVRNLEAEGMTAGVMHTGDVMYDATVRVLPRARQQSRILERLDVADRPFALATIHRAETTDDPSRLRAMACWLKDAATRERIVFPIHPRTARAATLAGIAFDGVRVCEPVGFLDMTRLLDACKAVYTDSGGLQKEAYFHHKPCVTLRESTEWVETIACGWNRLWHQPDYLPRTDITDYGDGRAATRVVDALLHQLR